MWKIIFNSDSVTDSLTQAYKEIKKEGYQQYILLGVRNGGENVADRLSAYGGFEDTLSCKMFDDSITISVPSKIKNKNVLICEDTVNTGKTIKSVIEELKRLGANDIKIFSLFMRRNSSIIPNIFVFEYEKDTKIFFPWSDYPIRAYPKGIVRKISGQDCSKNFECTNSKINKNTLSDYHKNQQNFGTKVYLIEDKDEICAIIQFCEKEVNKYKGLFLDVIASAKGKEGHKYAKTLLKLIMFYMFYHEFDFVYGYAFDEPKLIEMYKAKGYDVIGSRENSHYGKLHTIVMVHKKNDKEEVFAAIRKRI